MYRSVKGKITSCLGVLGKRRRGVSNNPECVAVSCCHGGEKLWKQQDKHKMRQLSTSKRSTICLRRLSANVGRWTVRHTLSAVFCGREGFREINGTACRSAGSQPKCGVKRYETRKTNCRIIFQIIPRRQDGTERILLYATHGRAAGSKRSFA